MLVLALIIHFAARHESAYSVFRLLLVSVVLGVAHSVLFSRFKDAAILFDVPLMVLVLHEFCYMRISRAILVTFIYQIAHLFIQKGLYRLSGH
jgi:hypothetical protein